MGKAKTIKARVNRKQLQELLNYAQHIRNVSLASLAMRTLDGDSVHHTSMLERCTVAYAGARHSDDFKTAQQPVKVKVKVKRTRPTIVEPVVIENEIDAVRDAIEEAAHKMTFAQYKEFITQLDEHVTSCAGAAIDRAHCFHRLKGE